MAKRTLWSRYELNWIHHPKFRALASGAIVLWLEGKAYADEHLTDGLLPEYAVRSFRFYTKARVDELLATAAECHAPLWERHAVGFKMHDYLDHNPSREQVLKWRGQADAERARKAKNQADYRSRKTGHVTGTSEQKAGHVTGHVPLALPPHIRPETTDVSPEEQETPARDRLLDGFNRFALVYPKRAGETAWRTWVEMAPSEPVVEAIVAGAQRYAAHVADWDDRYIKTPKNWLLASGWLDDYRPKRAPLGAVPATWECPHTPACTSRNNCHVLQQIAKGRAS